MNEGWHRVSRNSPCPICNHTDWCMVTNDGAVCLCQRVESDHPTRNSGGWIHRLKTAEKVETLRKPSQHSQHSQHSQPSISDYFNSLPTGGLQHRMCAYYEAQLGLPCEILEAMDWRCDISKKAAAIPMRNAFGEITGIRYRSWKSSAKWSREGSKDGLFFDPEFIPYDPEELVICEGPTDTAAAMACGIWAVGRSSCRTGRDAIRELVRFKSVKRITIVADDDPPKPRPGGGTWQPGLDGAKRLAEQLRMAYRIVLPPPGFKDLRDWYRAGTLNETSFQNMIRGNDWHGPDKEHHD